MLDQLITYRTANSLTVADILRVHWDEYKQQYPVTAEQAKVVGSVMTREQSSRLDTSLGRTARPV